MSILSKVKGAVKKVAGAIKGAAGKVASGLGANTLAAVNTLKSGGAGNFNAAPKTKSSGLQLQVGNSNSFIPISKNTNSGTITNASRGNLSAGDGTNLSLSYGGGGVNSSPIYSAPVTLMGGQRPGSKTANSDLAATSLMSFFGEGGSSSVDSSSFSSSSAPISVPSAPGYANPGQINNGGQIADWMNSGYEYDPNTNMAVPVAQEGGEQNDAQKRNSIMESLTKLIPQKESVQNSEEIRAQQREVQRRQQEVAGYTSQLNSVVAQQNADLLRLRGIGSQEGVTETVYGGQAATINREAAIKALPIQAQLAGAQGNLELAQDYLTQLTSWKQEQIDNDYQYKTALYNSISEYVKGEQKIILDDKRRDNDRAWEMTKSNIALQDSLMKEAISSGQPGLIGRLNNINPSSPNFRQEISTVARGLASSVNSTATKELSSKQQSKVDSINTVSAQLANYRSLYEQFVGKKGSKLTGVQASQLRTAKASLEFAVATAVGTGALQAADRDVVRDILPDPTSIKGAAGQFLRGGKQGGIASLNEAQNIFESAKNSITGGVASPISSSSGVKTSSGKTFDVAQAKAAGYTDAEIQEYLRTH